jgi:hypothetical protein
MKFLIVTQPPKINVTTITLAITVVTAWTSMFLKQYIILSTHKGTTDHTFIETLQNCLRFQRTPMNSSPIHKIVLWLVASLILLVSSVFSVHLGHSLNTMLSTVCYLRCQMVARLLIWPLAVTANHVFQFLNHHSCELSYMWPEMATY